MKKKTTNKDLTALANSVKKLSESRKARMEARAAKVKAMEEEAPAEEEAEEEEAAEEEASEEEASEEEAEVEATAEEAPAAPAEEAPAVEVEAAAEVEAAQASDAPNGGFEGHEVAKAADNADLGEEEYGYSVPPELEKAVEDGKAEDSKDESYQPGILVPPGLEDAVMAFVDPASLSADAEVAFDMIPFMPNANTAAEVLNAGAHWMLVADGDPLAKIELNRQDNKDVIAAHFVTADYARGVIEGISEYGLQATLEFVNATPYVAKIDENARIAQLKAELQAEAAESLRTLTADAKSKFIENISLVLQASAANFIVENPLKDSLIAFMTSAGMPEGVAAEGVDNAFFQHGTKTLAGLLDKAEEWSNYSPEALGEVKAALEQAGRRARPMPSQLTPAQANPDYDHALAAKMVANTVNVATPACDVSASTPSPEPASADSKADFRKKFGRFS